MEVSGIALRRPSCFSGEIGLSSSRRASLNRLRKSTLFPGSGFSDEGHQKYYYGGLSLRAAAAARCAAAKEEIVKEKDLAKKNMKMMKKRMKLLKGLSKDLAIFSEMGFGLNTDSQKRDDLVADPVTGKMMISEATEILLRQLKQLKTEEEQQKKKRKEEKAKLKAAQLQLSRVDCEESSSCSSESSDDECEEVMDMNRLKSENPAGNRVNESETPNVAPQACLPQLEPITDIQEAAPAEVKKTNEEAFLVEAADTSCISTKCNGVMGTPAASVSAKTNTKMIEVCMGGKCKKSGAPTLLEEFQKAVGVEGAVVGCKCMGKCRSGPNVRVRSEDHDVEQQILAADVEQQILAAAAAQGVVEERDSSIKKTNTNPLLCIGVGFQDVGLIVSRFFGESQDLVEAAAAAAAPC